MSERIAAGGEVILCSSVPTQLLAGLLGYWIGIPAVRADRTMSLAGTVFVTAVDTVVLILLMLYFMRRRGERPRDLWLGPRPVGEELRHGVLLIPLTFVIVVVLLASLQAVAPWLHNVKENPLESLARGGTTDAVILGLVALVAGGVREELVRAFLLRRFEVYLGGMTTGVVVISVAFGLGHIYQGWDAGITTGVLGLFWAIIYARRRSSVAPIVSHAGFNTLGILQLGLTGTR